MTPDGAEPRALTPDDESIRRLLAAAAAHPEPIPPHVADRLDAQLASLVAAAARPRLLRRRWPVLLAAAAAVSVVAVGVGNLLGPGGPGSTPGSDAAAKAHASNAGSPGPDGSPLPGSGTPTAPMRRFHPTPAAPVLGFSRVEYDPPGSDTGSNSDLNAEWAGITNHGTKPRVLTGWTIRDLHGHVYTFPTFTLPPGRSVRLHTGSGHDTATNLYWRQLHYVWNNTEGQAILRNQNQAAIDTYRWGGGSRRVTPSK